MDVGNQGWRDFWINYALETLNVLHPCNGIFMDEVWGYLPTGAWSPWTVPTDYIPQDVKDRWYDDQLEMVKQVKTALGTKKLVINSQERMMYVAEADGACIEGFAHPSWWSEDTWTDEWPIIDKIDELMTLCDMNKIVIIKDGASSPSDEEKYRQIWFYSLGCSLLGISGKKAYISFGDYWNDPWTHGYQPEMALDLGTPLGAYYVQDDLYLRRLTKSIVIVNLSMTETYSTTINEIPVTLGPHSTQIISTPVFPVITLESIAVGATVGLITLPLTRNPVISGLVALGGMLTDIAIRRAAEKSAGEAFDFMY